MTKVLSVSVRAKVWEIKKVAERFVISHQHKKIKVIIIACPARAYLDKKCNKSQGRSSIGWWGSWRSGGGRASISWQESSWAPE
jgi:hypothetical protein